MTDGFFSTPLRGMITLVVILIVIFVILIIGHSVNWLNLFGTPTPTPTPPPSTTLIPNTGIIIYKSPLGISFEFMPQPFAPTGPTFTAGELGSRIYIHDKNQGPTTGQFVEVFTKNPNDSLADAIKKTILANYPSDCIVADYPNNGGYSNNFTTAEIQATDNNYSSGFISDVNKCSAYARTNGIRYFLMDKNHPDKFFYFDIGQYSIPGSALNLPWQLTIQVQ